MLGRECKGVCIMRTSSRGAAAGLSFTILALSILALVSTATSSLAQTAAKSLKDQLVGHWQLVSVTINDRTPYGANPQGSMFFDAGRHFSVIVLSAGEARSISYFGTYTLDEAAQSLTLEIGGSVGGSGTSAAGREVRRLLKFSGDELALTNETPSGAPGAVTTTWKRAN